MTTAGTDAATVFEDAQAMLDAALSQLAAGDLGDAAEKAWCATKRATDGLILARTGELPPKSPDTTRRLLAMSERDPAVRDLRGRYFERQSFLHGDCFYTGLCEPVEAAERLIRETAGYTQDAHRLAAG